MSACFLALAAQLQGQSKNRWRAVQLMFSLQLNSFQCHYGWKRWSHGGYSDHCTDLNFICFGQIYNANTLSGKSCMFRLFNQYLNSPPSHQMMLFFTHSSLKCFSYVKMWLFPLCLNIRIIIFKLVELINKLSIQVQNHLLLINANYANMLTAARLIPYDAIR